jgi:signal transduction histidine kinase/DNA-binding response OmpR family regulator
MGKLMPDADKSNILVVDDLPEKILVYQTILEELGQRIITARSGAEALKQILLHDFAVILLDVNMPDIDGFETAALIRKRKKSAHTPIIFVTAFTDEVRTAQGYAHGAVDYIASPVIPEILRAKVRVFVELFRMTQQVQRQAEERVILAEEKSKRAAAEEATRRSSFLAEIATVLASSLDHETTVCGFPRQVVPYFADLAGLTLVGEPGHPWRSELAWVMPPAGEIHTLSLNSPQAPVDELRASLERVLATGKSEVREGLAVAYPPPAGAEPSAAAGLLHSAALLPLRARGRTLGALVLALADPARHFTPADLGYAEDLAGRAAIAIDNARLYREVQEADRRKNEFLSMLAHELRNPLAPISNAVQVLRMRGLDQPELHWARDIIERQVKHMTRLVDDLLDISRITRGKIRLQREPVEIGAVVALAVEASRPAIEARHHHFDLALPHQSLWVDGDAARLAQVLTNLLNNAAKYTEEGGTISLSASQQGAEIVVRIRDTGIGIPADMLGAVFDLFTQVDRALDRSQGGLGIGLTLVRRLVEMHGGSVEAHSGGGGRGSEFVVRLPARASQQAPAPARPHTETPQALLPQGRVLVVDDNQDSADSLAQLLRLGGFDVYLAHDGPAALESARTLTPDIVMLDIGLPGMDGYEVARRLRATPAARTTLLVAVTGYGQKEDRDRSHQAGFDHHLVKPVDYGVLQKLLASHQPATEHTRGNGRNAKVGAD